MSPRTPKPKAEQTTAQRLSSVIKAVRDIMRKDKGLSGDADRLPLLTWLMFLKFLDDLEEDAQAEAQYAGRTYRPVIEEPYRWRDWARSNLTGDDLTQFIASENFRLNEEQTMPGLFAYLRGLQGEGARDRRTVVAEIFSGVQNRMQSGVLLKEVIQKLDTLDFSSSEESHTLGALYEGLLKEMRDAAGDAGEFYTPRPVVRLIVKALDPRLGESVLDPACGTGGFLVEAFEHLQAQAQSTEDHDTLQNRSIYGGEAKPLPYLLAQMNLTLHGLEAPQIDSGNSLRHNLTTLGDAERVDVILANPPFGGEEEKGIQNNFPADKRTDETALLFMQLIMRRLRRQTASQKGGRAGVVVPNGFLFSDGVGARIKQELMTDFNLHTIVRLPNGIFAPYTAIPTNILFFERGGPTKEVWYYEHPLPVGKKNYTKTSPVQFEEFAPLLAWWGNREENERAWRVDASVIAANNYNLDVKNPHAAQDFEHMPPEQLLADIVMKERHILALLEELQAEGGAQEQDHHEWTKVKLGEVLTRSRNAITLEPTEVYKQITVRMKHKGVTLREQKRGSDIGTPRQYVARPGQFIISSIDARNGAMGLVPDELDGAVVTNDFWLFDVDENQMDREWLRLYASTPDFVDACTGASEGSTNRVRLQPDRFAALEIPLPTLSEQRCIVARLKRYEHLYLTQEELLQEIAALERAVRARAFAGPL